MGGRGAKEERERDRDTQTPRKRLAEGRQGGRERARVGEDLETERQGGRKRVCEHLGQGPRPASVGPAETEFVAPLHRVQGPGGR